MDLVLDREDFRPEDLFFRALQSVPPFSPRCSLPLPHRATILPPGFSLQPFCTCDAVFAYTDV